jgi:aldehyde:ferredoxin oxidoreductase
VVCKFLTPFALMPADVAELLNAVTGWDWTPDDLMQAGERIYNLERLFINREGFGREQDTLPVRLLNEPMPEGPAKGRVVELDEMLDEYYKLRGWVDGKPRAEKLRELGLAEYAA